MYLNQAIERLFQTYKNDLEKVWFVSLIQS